MKRPRRHKNSLMSRERNAERTTFTRADTLKVWGYLISIGAAGFLFFHFATTSQQRSSLDDLVHRRWRLDYHLSEEQARKLRKMEEDFHGSGNPFFRPSHNAAETTEHHRQMAAVMSREDGERFFAVMEGKGHSVTTGP